jgi:hypothetical protein
MPFPLLGQISEYSYAVPVVVGAYRFRKLGFLGKGFFFYCLFLAMGMFTEDVIGRMGMSNHSFMKIFAIGQTIYMTILFCLFVKAKRFRISAIFFLLVFLVTSGITQFYLNANDLFNSTTLFSRGILSLIFGAIMVNIATNIHEVQYFKNPLFWFGSALLVYNAGTIMILSFGNELYKMGLQYFEATWYVNWALLTLSNLLYSYTILCFHNE